MVTGPRRVQDATGTDAQVAADWRERALVAEADLTAMRAERDEANRSREAWRAERDLWESNYRACVAESAAMRAVVEAAREFQVIYEADRWGTDEVMLETQMIARNLLFARLAAALDSPRSPREPTGTCSRTDAPPHTLEHCRGQDNVRAHNPDTWTPTTPREPTA